MPIYGYMCPECGDCCEAFRLIEDRDRLPVCLRASHPEMQRIIGYGVQIVASPWYDKAGVFDGVPIGESQKDRLEQRKRDDKENDKSWDGKAPAKSDYRATGAVDIFKKLTQDTVHKELAAMNEGD